jgi:RNA polymerase sigma-70 factor (ECF subfamily)
VFLKAGKFKAKSRFSTWLYRIAHNRAIDFLKRRRHEPKLVLNARARPEGDEGDYEIPSSADDPSEISQRRELETKVMEVIGEMEDKYRSVFVLCAMKKLSYEDASGITGLPVKTVSSRLCRARKFFRARVQPFLDASI